LQIINKTLAHSVNALRGNARKADYKGVLTEKFVERSEDAKNAAAKLSKAGGRLSSSWH
jgi:hypothetical protein